VSSDSVGTVALPSVHETAIVAARIRAVHLLVDGEPKLLRDTLAARMIGSHDDDIRAWWQEVKGQFPSTAPWVLRARYVEDRLTAVRSRGVTQYVMLGAGLDSFAYRNRDWRGGFRVFEVDEPELQAWKKQRLSELGVEVPPSCVFAPSDLRRSRQTRYSHGPASSAPNPPWCHG
jgi:methyltransferase (TIGR00027 family)